jgi:hypothetical protein
VTRALPIDVAVDVAAWFEQLPAKVHRGLMCRLAWLSAVMRRYSSRGHELAEVRARGWSRGSRAQWDEARLREAAYVVDWTVCLSSSTV